MSRHSLQSVTVHYFNLLDVSVQVIVGIMVVYMNMWHKYSERPGYTSVSAYLQLPTLREPILRILLISMLIICKTMSFIFRAVTIIGPTQIGNACYVLQ